MPAPRKILIIRLSAIGDIVLCSPVLRSLRACHPAAEIHFLTKAAFAPLLQHNPHIDRVISFHGDLSATVKELKAQGYDCILDLHRNIRSRLIRARLRLPAAVYPKDRMSTTLYTKFRIGQLSGRHTVARYAVALAKLGCQLDDQGLEFYLPPEAHAMADEVIARTFRHQPIAVALGGGLGTKRWPKEHFAALLKQLGLPVILLGGREEAEEAAWIAKESGVHCLVAVGQYDLLLSAALLARSRFAIAHDTGFMHIGVAMGVPLYTLWGSTVPAFGFSPYRPKAPAVILQVEGLSCRPCSKIGYDQCPKGHFKCMRDLSPAQVVAAIRANEPGIIPHS